MSYSNIQKCWDTMAFVNQEKNLIVNHEKNLIMTPY